MLRDVFYYGKKPNVHPKEQPANNLVDARKKATTEHFWVINEFCDYTNFDWDFDFEFLPDGDVWAEDHNNVWPSKHQKDSGTWLCTKNHSDVIVYRCDVEPLKRKNIVSDNWKIIENINVEKWDFSWHPDPTDPPFIYRWGSKYAPAELNTCLEYRVEDATDIKYMNTIVELLPNWDCIVEVQKVDQIRWDMSWRPDPMDPPFIYVWGNKYVDGKLKATLEYHVPGAIEKKYMNELVPVLPEWDRWDILHDIDKTSFDFCWRPDPREPDYIYVFGNEQYEGGVMPTVEYRMPLATERKYLYDMKAKLSPHPEKFEHLEKADGIDYSWVPDPTAPPYIYAWGNQWNKPEDKVSIQYVVDGATEYRYMEQRSKRKPSMNDNWLIPTEVDVNNFDFSWEPSPADPAYIYEFGTQWQKTGGPRYVVEGATEVKYIEFQKVKALSTTANWSIPTNCDVTGFDFSWHPDSTSPPYTYHFATQWALTGGPIYNMEGATEVKYVEHPSAIALPSKENWDIPDYIDSNLFDFSWHPYIEDQPYIYQFGTQHQKTGGPRYITPGVIPSSPIKYIDTRIIRSIRKSSKKNFAILNNYKIKDFDWSWHPDDTDEPYIYVFGNTQYPAEIMPTIEYAVPGATQIKYVSDIVAVLDVDMTNWEVPSNTDISIFDFSWKPNPKDPAFIYQFGTQHQKTGGPRYIVPDADEVKYVTTHKVTALPTKDNWAVPSYVDTTGFDFSWHPDDTSPPYVYHFATQWALTGGPVYTVPGATETKYLEEPSAIALPNKDNWEVPDNIDVDAFDFSWHPYVEDQPYIYQFGTQHQKTGGPRYVTPGVIPSSPIKYIDTRILKATRKVSKKNFAILNNYKIKDFDWSWHPDDTDEPYIYVFGNNQYPAEIMPTVEYVVPGAKQVKYVYDVIATLTEDKTNWIVYRPIDESKFDFSWKPNPKDPAYVYRWGNAYVSNKYQPTIEYVVPGATEIKYMDDLVNVTPEWDRWVIPDNVDTTGFDFNWRPDPLEPNLIWQFGTQWQKTGGPTYVMPDAVDIKYIDFQKVKILSNPTASNWELPKTVDVSNFDFSWHPDATSPPYIYHFATQWALTGGPIYTVPNATETKYLEEPNAIALPNKDNWEVPDYVDVSDFDFSWHPYVEDQPYIYQFGTQWQKTGGPRYVTPGVIPSSPIKYIDTRILKSKRLPNKKNFAILNNYKIKDFDWSWHPDDTDEPYIYVFGNTQHPAEIMPTVEYVVPGAKQIKYVNDVVAILDVDMTNWEIPDNVDTNGFDFSWKPNPKDPAFIYEFGTQWQKTGGPRYVVPDATEVKYVTTQHVKALANHDNWTLPANIDVTDFDFSWHPDATSPPYNYHFATQWALSGGPIYKMNGAIATKYMDSPSAKALPNKDNWEIPTDISEIDFDFSWHPYVEDDPYIYQFGTQWQKTGGPRYVTPGAKRSAPVKYIDTRILTAKKLPTKDKFTVLNNLSVASFDWSWHPDETDGEFIYVFGNTQYPAEVMPTIEYRSSPYAEKIKYINDIKAVLATDLNDWYIPTNIDVSEFDFSWKPNPNDPPYIYQFGTQWQKTGGPRYSVEGAIEIKYVEGSKAKSVASKKQWIVPTTIDSTRFDFSWHPDETEEPYIYQFGTQWQKTGGPRYITTGSTSDTPLKYITELIAERKQVMTNWIIPEGTNAATFDFSWHPDELAPPYIYQFGTVTDDKDGPKYVPAVNNGEVVFKQRLNKPIKEDTPLIEDVVIDQYYIETTLEDLVSKHPDKIFWALNPSIDYKIFDFSWRPEIVTISWESDYVHVFGSPDSPLTQTYFVNAKSYLSGKKDFKFVENVKLSEEYLSTLFVKPDMFFVDRGNSESSERFALLKSKFGNIQKTRYLNSWVDTINRCINRSSTELCWILNSELDYSDFDFNYYPNPWQMKMVHVFGTQWSHWGTTFIVNRDTFSADTKYIKIIEHLSNLNFVKDRTAKATNVLYDMYYIDHGNSDNLPSTNVVPYDTDYFTTFKNILSKLPEKKEHYIWIASTVCDYTGFDFTYICDPFAREQLHVFPSDKQKFGDTFLVNVNKLRELIDNMQSLKDYDKINFNQHQRTKRLAPPTIVTEFDTHVASVMQDFDFPYAVFVTEDNKDIVAVEEEPMNLWDIESKNILITSTGGTRIVVPKEAKQYVETQLYDYPYIKTSSRLARSNPLDIVYLSNGESCAEENYEHLLKAIKGLENRIVRVDGVNGRVQAYHAAAEASNTPWLFTVFAKLKVNTKFDFNWQPDRLQIPKHYMFLAKNPVNSLIYGHQGMIAYNKQMTLDNPGYGLDFTLDSPHETVELLSGVATYNTDEWSTWRTAFREVIKLKKDGSEISLKRLESWLNKADGNFAQYSIEGASDGIAYFNEVNGKTDMLRLSYEWAWLRNRFDKKYNK